MSNAAIQIPEWMLGPQPKERKPGDFVRDDRGTPLVTDPVRTKRPTGNKPELIDKAVALGIPADTTWTVAKLIAALPTEPFWTKYGRPSAFGKQLENTYNLEKWNERQIVLGIATGGEWTDDLTKLVPADQDDSEWRSLADGLVVESKRAAKAMLAADRGTHTHLLTELDDEGHDWLTQAEHGEDLGLPTGLQATLVEAWRTMLADLGFEIAANEACVINDRWRLAGTLDRIARLTRDLTFTTAAGEIVTLQAGDHIVLDIKTGKITADEHGYPRYWHTYAVQVAAYADGVPYDTDTNIRGAWPFTVRSDWAVIAHLDVLAALEGNPSCVPILVDINAGRSAGDLCLLAKQWQKRTDLFGRLHQVAAGGVSSPNSNVADDATPPADEFTVTTSNSHQPPVQVTYTRQQLRDRIAGLITAGHELELRRMWPEGVPPLSKPGHTADQLIDILNAVKRCETETSTTFHPDDTPDPVEPPDPEPELPAAAELDEGGPVIESDLQALGNAFTRLSDLNKKCVAMIATEASEAGRSISVSAFPTVRRWSIARAVVTWAETQMDYENLFDHATTIATPEQTADPDQTLGALLGSFTIEQANRLHDALDHTVAA